MQNTTADYKIEINKPSRQFECKITIGNNIYTNEDLVNLTLEYTQPQEGFSIGNTISQSLDLTLLNKGDTIYSTSQIKVEIGLKIASTIEYILMGIFNIDDIEKTDYTTKFTAYDNMIKFETTYYSSLGDKPTLQQVVNELSSKTGVEFTGSLPSYTVSKLEGFTCREVLSYVASICGGNAFITRDGKFAIKSLGEVEKSIDGNNYFEYIREEIKYKVGQISCQVDENNILSKGSIGIDSMELGFENPWVTETILTEIYNKLNGLSYLGYSMKWQGDISLDPYDIITVTDVKNVVRKIPILSQKLTYTGGLTSEIGAKGETKNKNSFSSSGSTTNKVNRLVTEQAVIKEALIEKANIQDLEAVSIKTQTLEAKTAKIEEAIIDVAYIKDLTAINANIQTLFANDATINNALINKADITDLTATNIKFDVAFGGTLDLQTLLAKHITGENGQFINISSDNTVIANAVIKDAMIENVSLNKLLAGTISTNKFNISSDDGGIEIVGATQQFKDKNNKVRIQMGQDTLGNFNFILRGEDGTTTLIDHTGIKEKAIADDLIKENMIASNAIGEKQINYSSLITGLNKDTNTSLIKASKVAIDLTGQSLEVSFNSLKSNVEGIQVGGRNYIRPKNVEYYSPYCIAVSNEYNGWTVTKVGTHPYVAISQKGYKPTAGKTYTFSGYATKNGEPISDGFFVSKKLSTYEGNAIIKKISSGYFEITQEWASNSNWLIHGQLDIIAGDVVEFRNIKFEEGNKATDFTVAPEDIDQKIESNTTSITVAQGKIEGLISETSIVKGDITTLKDNYTSIKATVDGINTTVASHSSSIGTINTNISGLSGKVTTVENNYTSLSQNLEGFKTTVGNTYSTKSELSGVDGKVSSLTSRVSTAESSITQLNNQIKLKVEAADVTEAINNVEIGGRNLIKDSSIKGFNPNNTGLGTSVTMTNETEKYMRATPSSGKNVSLYYFASKTQGAISGEKYIFSIMVRSQKDTTIDLYDNRTSGTRKLTQVKANVWTQVSMLPAIYTDFGGAIILVSNVVDSYLDYKLLKFEKGDKPTAWTPAPEDIETRMTTAEQKITPTAITTTISEVITGGTGSISTTQFIMDKNGLTINNGALTIKNKSGTTVFTSDTSGNLTLSGTVKSQSGDRWVAVRSGGIDFATYSATNGIEEVAQIASSSFPSNRDQNGLSIATKGYGDYIQIGYTESDGSITAAMYCVPVGAPSSFNLPYTDAGIYMYDRVYFKKNAYIDYTMFIKNKYGTDHAIYNNGENGYFNIMGDNGISLGVLVGDNPTSRVRIHETPPSGTGDWMQSWGNWNFCEYTFHNAHLRGLSLSVSGSKNCLQKTENYGDRLINAYETAEYYFGDLGFGKINSNGECLIAIDDIFQECVNTKIDYHIFTQCYNGSIKSIERYETYFIVKGEPETEFSWELKAKRIGYENNRLDMPEIAQTYISDYESIVDDNVIETSEEVLTNELNFRLEDLLMEG